MVVWRRRCRARWLRRKIRRRITRKSIRQRENHTQESRNCNRDWCCIKCGNFILRWTTETEDERMGGRGTHTGAEQYPQLGSSWRILRKLRMLWTNEFVSVSVQSLSRTRIRLLLPFCLPSSFNGLLQFDFEFGLALASQQWFGYY